jgi:hypothetical protein
MKAYWGVKVYFHSFFDLGTRWRWVVSFTPRPLYPGERASDTHWIGGWVGPRAVLDAAVKRKIPSPRRESNPRTQIVQPVAQHYTDWAITALRHLYINYRQIEDNVLAKDEVPLAGLTCLFCTKSLWVPPVDMLVICNQNIPQVYNTETTNFIPAAIKCPSLTDIKIHTHITSRFALLLAMIWHCTAFELPCFICYMQQILDTVEEAVWRIKFEIWWKFSGSIYCNEIKHTIEILSSVIRDP